MPDDSLILAMTTIGDLFFGKKITKTMNNKPIEDVSLFIPDYQRPYKWKVRNAIQLLDDIIDAKNTNKEIYRVGTLILYEDKEGNFYIVDGQQRTITFSLLLYALYENEREENRKEISFLSQQVFDNEYTKFNIPNNLDTFRRRVSKRDEEEDSNADFNRTMKQLRDYIEKRCELIVVITKNIFEAFQFFDSQNARGKALYPHDLLKAYHLREMADLDEKITEKAVKEWESISQKDLASFFGEYIYRIKEWINGNWARSLDEHNIYKFKGITKSSRALYAQFYKSAFSYAEIINNSAMPFVSGTRKITAFQLNTPIIAGKPFVDYTKYYYAILKDIQDNSKYEGFYMKGNRIVKTLDRYMNKGTGNKICRLLFDTAVLLYVDRFCPATYPDKVDLELFEQFIVIAFIWAYSLRLQYINVGWVSAQNYILETGTAGKTNSLNIYRLISETDTPSSLLSSLADKLQPVYYDSSENIDDIDKDYYREDWAYKDYRHFFKENNFLTR